MDVLEIELTFQPSSLAGGPIVKRDMELVREILLQVEAKEHLKPTPLKIDGYDEITVGRHIEMLFDKGLIEGVPHRSLSDYYKQLFVTDLTWEGHDFVAATRNKTVWNTMKKKLGDDLPRLPLEIVKGVALKILGEVVSGQMSG